MNAWRGVAARLCSDRGETPCNYNTSLGLRQGVVSRGLGRTACDERQCQRQCHRAGQSAANTAHTTNQRSPNKRTASITRAKNATLPVVVSQCTAHCQLRRCSVSPQKAHDCANPAARTPEKAPVTTRRSCAKRQVKDACKRRRRRPCARRGKKKAKRCAPDAATTARGRCL